MAAIPGRNRLDLASSENPMQITVMCLTSGEISSRAVVVLSIATAWARVRVWVRVYEYMASSFYVVW